VIVAPRASGLGELASQRADPATRLLEVTESTDLDGVGLAGIDNVILEGLDEVADPVALLRAVTRSVPGARLFALVANSAHFGALAALYRGTSLAKAHPLVEVELEPLLRDGGWQPLEIRRIYDEGIGQGPLPVRVSVPPLTFTVDDGEMLARGRVQAFVAIADPL
jgi:hypothetical protein